MVPLAACCQQRNDGCRVGGSDGAEEGNRARAPA